MVIQNLVSHDHSPPLGRYQYSRYGVMQDHSAFLSAPKSATEVVSGYIIDTDSALPSLFRKVYGGVRERPDVGRRLSGCW